MSSKIHKTILPNGLTILFKQVPSETVAIEFSVHTGSIMETKEEAGLSHFLEHLLFEGTKKRPSSKAIANEIEKYGGEFNAATSQERTFYYVKIAKKHAGIALDILHDMFSHSLFEPAIIEKERKVILDEINMVNDNPRQYQWILFNKKIFPGHPAALPVYGNVPALKAMARHQIVDYFLKWYVPPQISLVVVGDVPDAVAHLQKKCQSWIGKPVSAVSFPSAGVNKKTFALEKKKLNQSYFVLGYKTVVREHEDSVVLDIVSGILGRGQSGWLFDEIRAKRGLCYSIGIEHDANRYFGNVGIFCGTDKKNIKIVEKLVLEQLDKLKTVSASEIAEAKTFIEGSIALRHENTASLADEIAYWHQTASVAAYEQYLENVKKVTAADVQRIAKKYFTDQYTMVVLEQRE